MTKKQKNDAYRKALDFLIENKSIILNNKNYNNNPGVCQVLAYLTVGFPIPNGFEKIFKELYLFYPENFNRQMNEVYWLQNKKIRKVVLEFCILMTV